MSNALLAAAISAVTNNTIVTYDDYMKEQNDFEYFKLDQKSLHQSHLIGGKVPKSFSASLSFQQQKPTPPPPPPKELLMTIKNSDHLVGGKQRPASFFRQQKPPPPPPKELYIITLSGKIITLKVTSKMKVKEIKSLIQCKEGIPPDQQRLMFDGNKLNDEHSLAHYKIQIGFTLYLRLKSSFTTLYLQPELLAPKFDYDFTNINDDGKTYMRGNFEYKRPCGWKRIALNVLDKYGNNTWLGASRGRHSSSKSVRNEWPVSYHGTKKHNCKSIADDGYLLCKGKRFAFGHGIYSTPNIEVASRYATNFTHKGEKYKVVIQNRVNPKNLIRISESQTGRGEYWISPNGRDVRPYGICIKKVD